MFHRGATAVEKFTDCGYFVAIKGEGLYFYDGNDHWEELLILDKTIRSLKMLGTYLFGVGEEGFIFRLNTEDFTSLKAHLPTTAAIWSITGNDSGHAVIHGKFINQVITADHGQVTSHLKIWLQNLSFALYVFMGTSYISVQNFMLRTEACGNMIAAKVQSPELKRKLIR